MPHYQPLWQIYAQPQQEEVLPEPEAPRQESPWLPTLPSSTLQSPALQPPTIKSQSPSHYQPLWQIYAQTQQEEAPPEPVVPQRQTSRSPAPPSATLLDLPTELLQEVAFFSFNPNLYLVCRGLRSQLCPQTDFLKDLALILLCNRRHPKSVFYLTSLPWSTGPARRWDLMLAQDERLHLQRQVFDLEYTTASRLSSMIYHVQRSNSNLNTLSTSSLPVNDPGQSFTYSTIVSGDANEPLPLTVEQQPELSESPFLNRDPFSMGPRGVFVSNMLQSLKVPNLFIVHVLYIPTRLIGADKGVDAEELGRLFLSKTTMDSLNHSIVKRYMATAKPRWMYT